MYNFHPYMGQYQAGDTKKNPDGFEKMVQLMHGATDAPLIVTEFGQFCCETHGSCYDYNGFWNDKKMGYVEAIIQISQKYSVSWTPWSWRPAANEVGGNQCADLNTGDTSGTELANPTNGKGADWLTLWNTFANQSGGPQETVFEE